MESTFSKAVLKVMFAIYCIVIAYIVFIYHRQIDLAWLVKGGLFSDLEATANFIPFKNILKYIIQMNRATGLNIILENIVAHMFIFSWMGYFLPRLWERFQNPLYFLRTVFFVLLGIEVVQFLLRAGMFDVDDIIINFIAAFVGFVYLRHIDAEEEENPYV